MNILSYQMLETHGLSFEILVDDKPISALVRSSDTSIPYWLFETGVALYPITRMGSDTDRRVVAVCCCGAFGCSCISCNIVRSWDDNIVFRDFARDPYDPNPAFNSLLLYFSLANYDAVITDIFQEINKFKIN